MTVATADPLDWHDWPEEKKRLLRARLLERAAQREWEQTARPEQIIRRDSGLVVMIAGRRSGKTRAASEWLAERLMEPDPGLHAIAAPTFGQARDVCVESPSGVIAALRRRGAEVTLSREGAGFQWNRSIGELRHEGATVMRVDGLDEGAPRIQGHEVAACWVDELRLVAERPARMALDESIRPALSGSTDPQMVVTTTPRPSKLIRELLNDPAADVRRMTTWDNADNLPDAYLAELKARYPPGSRRGRQEVLGQLLEDVEGALWAQSQIDALRADSPPYAGWQGMPVVGVDPADGTEDGAEHALVVVAQGMDHDLYVVESEGFRVTPAQFAREAIQVAQRHGARIVIEKNHGGAWLEAVFRGEMRDMGAMIAVKLVSASQGKRTRAEPVAALAEQGRLRMLGEHADLERVLTEWTGAPGEASPDLLDAMVWAASEWVGRSFRPASSESGVASYDQPAPGVVRWG